MTSCILWRPSKTCFLKLFFVPTTTGVHNDADGISLDATATGTTSWIQNAGGEEGEPPRFGKELVVGWGRLFSKERNDQQEIRIKINTCQLINSSLALPIAPP